MRKTSCATLVALVMLHAGPGLAQPDPPPADTTPSPPPVITIVPPPQQQQQPPAPQPPPQQQQKPPEPPKEEGERQGMSNFGVGFAYAASLKGSAGTRSTTGYGLVLEFGRTIPLSERVDFGLRFAWGLTEWDRFTKWAKGGYDVGAWTTQAYEDTYNWTRKHEGGVPETHGLRIMGAFFAFAVLWIGYIVAGVAYAAAIFAPTTYLEMDLTANYNFGEDPKNKKGVNPYVKGGLGLMAFIHPDHGTLLGAIGPTFGTGVRIGSLNLAANMTWSPPPLHGEARGGSTHILTGGLTIGVQN